MRNSVRVTVWDSSRVKDRLRVRVRDRIRVRFRDNIRVRVRKLGLSLKLTIGLGTVLW